MWNEPSVPPKTALVQPEHRDGVAIALPEPFTDPGRCRRIRRSQPHLHGCVAQFPCLLAQCTNGGGVGIEITREPVVLNDQDVAIEVVVVAGKPRPQRAIAPLVHQQISPPVREQPVESPTQHVGVAQGAPVFPARRGHAKFRHARIDRIDPARADRIHAVAQEIATALAGIQHATCHLGQGSWQESRGIARAAQNLDPANLERGGDACRGHPSERHRMRRAFLRTRHRVQRVEASPAGIDRLLEQEHGRSHLAMLRDDTEMREHAGADFPPFPDNPARTDAQRADDLACRDVAQEFQVRFAERIFQVIAPEHFILPARPPDRRTPDGGGFAASPRQVGVDDLVIVDGRQSVPREDRLCGHRGALPPDAVGCKLAAACERGAPARQCVRPQRPNLPHAQPTMTAC